MRRPWSARRATAVGLVVAGLLGVAPAAQGQSIDEQLRAAAGQLEDSTAAVQAAAAQLQTVSAALAPAREEAAAAATELAGAQAELVAATAAVRRAELAVEASQGRLAEGEARVAAGRAEVAQIARASYVRGPRPPVPVLESAGMTAYLETSALVDQVLEARGDTVRRLVADRQALAQVAAELEDDERAAEGAREDAADGERRAAEVAARAAAAEERVRGLVAQQAQVLAGAEQERAADLAAYQQAQAASAALEARLRAEAEQRRAAAAAASVPQPRAPPAADQGRMQWPADGRLTSRYGTRRHPIYGDTRFHAGIDIGAPSGSPIVAAEDGVVVFSGVQSGYGNSIAISHGTVGGRDLVTFYAHQSQLIARQGARVSRGQVIGRVGSTGNSTGPHLHFEVRLDGATTDPLDWVSPP